MKRKILAILVGIMLAFGIVGGVACDSCNAKHEHTYGQWTVSRDATCELEGEETRICSSCNEKETKKTAALGHKAVTVPGKDPTCAEIGYTESSKCERCDKDITVASELPMISHTYEQTLDDNDKPVINYNVINTEGVDDAEYHSIVTELVCKECGDVHSLNVTSKHVFVKSISLVANCATPGEYAYTCAQCGHSYTEVYTDANAHAWYSVNETTDQCANCTATRTVKVLAEGEKVAKEALTADTVLKLGTSGVELKLDQTTLGGLTGDIGLKAEPKAVADLAISEETKAAIGDAPVYDFGLTAGEDEVKDFNGGKITITVPYTLGANEDPDNISIWHVDGETITEYPATYSNGYVTFEAEHFSYYAVVRLTAEQYCKIFDHKYEDIGTPATCVRDGYEGTVCKRCGDLPATNKTVKATGHNYVEGTAIAPTCITEGHTPMTCSTCQDSYKTKAVAATGHTFKAGDKVAPTCKDRGYTPYTCEVCGVVENRDYVDRSAHTYASGNCSVCGVKEPHTDYLYINLLESMASDGMTLNIENVKMNVDVATSTVESYFDGEYKNETSASQKIEAFVKQYKIVFKVDENGIQGEIVLDATTKATIDGSTEEIEISAKGEIIDNVVQLDYAMTMNGIAEKGYYQINLNSAMSAENNPEMAMYTAMLEGIMDALDVDTLAAIQSVLTNSVETVTIPLSTYIKNTFFTATTVDGKKSYTVDWAKVKAFKADVTTKTFGEIYDAYAGEGKLDALIEDLKGFGNVTVDDMLKYASDNGLTEEILIALVNNIVKATMPETEPGQEVPAFDFAEMLTEEVRAMTVNQMIAMVMENLPQQGGGTARPEQPDYDYDIETDFEGGNGDIIVEDSIQTFAAEDEMEGADAFDIAMIIEQYAPMIKEKSLEAILGGPIPEEMDAMIDEVLEFLSKYDDITFSVTVDTEGKESINMKEIINNALGEYFNKYFTEATVGNEKTFTFKNEVIADFVSDLRTLKVKEFINKYYGEENYADLNELLAIIGVADLDQMLEAYEEMTLFDVLMNLGNMGGGSDNELGRMSASNSTLGMINQVYDVLVSIFDSDYALVINTSADNVVRDVEFTLPTAPIKLSITEDLSNRYIEDSAFMEEVGYSYVRTQDITISFSGRADYITSAEFNGNLFVNNAASTFFTTDGVTKFATDKNDSYVDVTVANGAISNIKAYLLIADKTYSGSIDTENGKIIETRYVTYVTYDGISAIALRPTADSNLFEFHFIDMTNSFEKAKVEQITIVNYYVLNEDGSKGELINSESTTEELKVEEMYYYINRYVNSFQNGYIDISTKKLDFIQDTETTCTHNNGWYTESTGKFETCDSAKGAGYYVNYRCSECGVVFKKNVLRTDVDSWSIYYDQIHDMQIVKSGYLNDGDSCDDGWYVLYKCANCGEINFECGHYHESKSIYKVNDFSDKNGCNWFKVEEYSCLCGEYSGFHLDTDCALMKVDEGEYWDNETYRYYIDITVAGVGTVKVSNLQKCSVTEPKCSIAIAYTYKTERVAEGACDFVEYRMLNVYTYENDVYTLLGQFKEVDSRWTEHNYQTIDDDKIVDIEGGTQRTNSYACTVCGHAYEEIEINTRVLDNGNYVETYSLSKTYSQNGVQLEKTFYEDVYWYKPVQDTEYPIYRKVVNQTERDGEINSNISTYTLDYEYITNIQFIKLVKEQTYSIEESAPYSEYYAECILVDGPNIDEYEDEFNGSTYEFWDWSTLGIYDNLKITDYKMYRNYQGETEEYVEWQVAHDIENCHTTGKIRYSDTVDFETIDEVHHYYSTTRQIASGSCATPYIYQNVCNKCGDPTGEEWVSNSGHDWDYQGEDVYVCNLCGLFNLNGVDGRVVLELQEINEEDGTVKFAYIDQQSGYYYWGRHDEGWGCDEEDEVTFSVIYTNGTIDGMIELEVSVTQEMNDRANEISGSYTYGYLSFSIADVDNALAEAEAKAEQEGIDLSGYSVGISVNCYSSYNNNYYLYQYVIN